MELHIVRVFVDADGNYGSYVGIVPDATAMGQSARQQLAAELGYPETIFVVNPQKLAIETLTPRSEIVFAGAPSVGAAWVLGRLRADIPSTFLTSRGPIKAWSDETQTWVEAPLVWTPSWSHERVESPETIASLTGPMDPIQDATQLWSWVDEPEGYVRARTFAARFGITEEEAAGSACMQLAATLGRDLNIHHGVGSRILARPGRPGYAAIGGYVIEVERRDLS